MDGWPISIREAARRLKLNSTIVATLVLGCRIPTRPIGSSKCLDQAGYAQLLEAAEPFLANKRRRQQEPVGS